MQKLKILTANEVFLSTLYQKKTIYGIVLKHFVVTRSNSISSINTVYKLVVKNLVIVANLSMECPSVKNRKEEL